MCIGPFLFLCLYSDVKTYEEFKEVTDLTRQVLENEKDVSPTLKLCVENLIAAVEILSKRVDQLEAKIDKNSRNSSKPPSSDDKDRVTPKKDRSHNKGGAKKGHKGKYLKQVDNPDKVISHDLVGTCSCGIDLSEAEILTSFKRQVFDIEIKRQTIEHRCYIGECDCGRTHRSHFPKEVTHQAQYGAGVRSLVTYLSVYQLIPVDRIRDFFSDLFNYDLAKGSVFNFNEYFEKSLPLFLSKIKKALLNSKILHADEIAKSSIFTAYPMSSSLICIALVIEVKKQSVRWVYSMTMEGFSFMTAFLCILATLSNTPSAMLI